MLFQAALKTFLFAVVVQGTVVGWLPYWLSRWNSGLPVLSLPGWRYVGWLLVVPGVAVLLSSLWGFVVAGQGTPAPIDPPKRLVVTGAYHFVRNPMYLGMLMALLGQFLLYESWNVLVYAGLFWFFTHWWIVLYEEPRLRHRFGDEYAAYCRQVSRWMPRFRRTRAK